MIGLIAKFKPRLWGIALIAATAVAIALAFLGRDVGAWVDSIDRRREDAKQRAATTKIAAQDRKAQAARAAQTAIQERINAADADLAAASERAESMTAAQVDEILRREGL